MGVRERPEVAAFHEFMAARSASLFRTAFLVVGDYQLAQDLVQESLVKTYMAWPRLRDVRNAEAYTRRVIVTTSISWRRRRSFHERPVEVLPEIVVADVADLVAAGPTCGPSCTPCRRGSAWLWCFAIARTSQKPRPPSSWAARSGVSNGTPLTGWPNCATGWARDSPCPPRTSRR